MESDDKMTADAAITIMGVLQPLSDEQRSRVLASVAALFGLPPRPNVNVATSGASPAVWAPSAGPIGDDPGRTPSAKPISLVELLKEKRAATNSQRIACFAYFREKVEGISTFSRGDLAAYFPKAKLAAPGPNYARDYNKVVREAWIHDDGAKSYLTQKGETAVESGFAAR